MIDKDCFEKIKDVSPFISWLKEEDREIILEHASLFNYEAGHILMNADENFCDMFFIVIEGSIKVSKISLEGREVVLYRLGQGEVCVVNASCILSDTVYTATATVETPSKVLGIPSFIVTQVLVDYPDFHRFIYSTLLLKMEEVVMKFEDVTFRSISDRIMDFFERKSLEEDSSTFNITHEELAIEIGSVREVASRALKSLEKEGKLELSRGQIKLI